jgi:hypothetical protein
MAKLDIIKQTSLNEDQELINDLKVNGFSLNFEGFYTRRIGTKGIQVTPDLKILVSDISNPGRDETWNIYARLNV